MSSVWRAEGGPWLPRMVTMDGYTVTGVVDLKRFPGEPDPLRLSFEDRVWWTPFDGHEIDETDAATLGAMLGEVRRLWGWSKCYVRHDATRDCWRVTVPGDLFEGDTEVKALSLARWGSAMTDGWTDARTDPPPTGKRVLVVPNRRVARRDADGAWVFDDGVVVSEGPGSSVPTHWMSLPDWA